MNRNRATQNRNLFTAIELGTHNDPAPQTTQVTASAKYIPVYHVELVRDRLIKVEPRPSIHNPDDIVAILQDELLKADREKLVCLMLNAKNVVIGMDIVSIGSLTASIAHPRLCVGTHNRGCTILLDKLPWETRFTPIRPFLESNMRAQNCSLSVLSVNCLPNSHTFWLPENLRDGQGMPFSRISATWYLGMRFISGTSHACHNPQRGKPSYKQDRWGDLEWDHP